MVDKDMKGHVDPEASKRAIIEHRYKAEYTDDEYRRMCNDLDLKLVEQWSYDFTLSLCKSIRGGKSPNVARQQVIESIRQRREQHENNELRLSELWNITSLEGSRVVSSKPLFQRDFEQAEGKSRHHHRHHHHLTKEQKRGIKRADYLIAHSHD